MKKSQFFGKPLFYLLVAIIIVLVVALGYTQIRKMMGFAGQSELKKFTIDMEENLKKYASGKYGGKGSVKEESFLLPADITSVCFVDRSKEIDPLINNELNSYIERFNESNLFFKPFSEFAPYSIGYFTLEQNPLCINVVSDKINLKLTNAGRGKTKIETIEIKTMGVECKKKLYHGENKMDIVFLAYGYDDKEDFSADVDYYIDNVFMKIEPFKTKVNRLNFYMVDIFSDLGCSMARWIRCDEFKVKQLASNCPHEYIIILTDRSKTRDLLNPIRSSVKSNIACINTADNRLVMAHELGHLLAKLADEYVDESHYKGIFDEEDYANCDAKECDEWSKVYGTGCFKGCSLGMYYRPTEESIMRSFRTSFFGPVNKKELSKAINAYS